MKIVRNNTKKIDVIGRNVVKSWYKPLSIKDPLDYLDGITDINIDSESIYDVMNVCRKLYKTDFLCGPAIDAYNNFATTPLRVEPTNNKRWDTIVEIFLDNLNYDTGVEPGMYHLMQRFGLGFLIDGNTIPLKTYELFDSVVGEIILPLRITLLNPMKIWVDKTSSQFGPRKLYYRVDDDLAKLIKKDARKSPEKRNIPKLIRRRYKTSLKQLTNDRFHTHIPLDPQLVSHIKRKAMDFEDWGIPYLTRTFRSVSVLNKLMKLDEATLDGLVNLITIFKLGSDEFPTSQARIDAFAALLESGHDGVTPNQTLVWSHDIDMMQVGPDGKVLSYGDRFKDARDNLRTALGLPTVISDGTAGGDVWVTLLPMLESLTAMRESQTVWLQDTLIQIAEQNDIVLEKKPVIIWDRMNLVNDAEIKNLILSFYDRGLLDPQTAIIESKRDFDSVLQRKQEFDKSGDALLFLPPTLPYSSPGQNDPNGKSPDNGRPKKTEPKKTKTETTAFELADYDIIKNIFSDIDKFAQSQDKSKFETYLIGKYLQLYGHIQNVNEIKKCWGISTSCREALEVSQNSVLKTFLSNELNIHDECRNLYNNILEIRNNRK